MKMEIQYIVCEDVRQEYDGRFSLMGVFDRQIYADEFPITLDRLYLHIQVRADDGEGINSVIVKVLSPYASPQTFRFPTTGSEKEDASIGNVMPQAVVGRLKLRPVEVQSSGAITAEIIVNGDLIDTIMLLEFEETPKSLKSVATQKLEN